MESSLLDTKKAKEVLGTWLESSFQVYFNEPPKIFSPFGVLTVPCIGVYGADYVATQPILLLKGRTKVSHFREVVGIPCEELKDAKEGAVMDVFFTVHTKPFPQECQKFTCDKFNEVNLVYHPWCFRGKDVSYSTVLEAKARMGVYNAKGVKEIHTDLKDSGVPVNRSEELSIVIHDCCFSPANAMLEYVGEETAEFWSTCVPTGGKDGITEGKEDTPVACATYHAMLLNETLEEAITKEIAEANTVGEALAILSKHSELSSVAKELQRFIDLLA